MSIGTKLTPAQKKKSELIAAAKIKQQYAKVLAKEGMQSVRVGGKGGVSARDALPSASFKGKGKGKAGEEEGDAGARAERRMAAAMADPGSDMDDDGDDSDSSDDDSDAEDEAARAAARMRQAAREADEARDERRARKAFEKGTTGTERTRPKDGRDRISQRKAKTPREDKPRVRALSPPKIDPKEGNMRELKREAFGKRHVGGGRGAGQPRMGARMDVLLEKIRRSK